MTISKRHLQEEKTLSFHQGYSDGHRNGREAQQKDLEYLKRSGALSLVEAVAKIADANAQLTTAVTHLMDNLGVQL